MKLTSQKFNLSTSGFTLIEILIAIAVFAIVITTVFGSYRIVFSSAEDIEKGNRAYQMAQGCLARMAVDLSSIQAPLYNFANEDSESSQYSFTGETYNIYTSAVSRLRFFSFAHCAFRGKREPGIAEIVYYVHESGDGSLVIRRADHVFPYPEFTETENDPVLCKNVKSFTITYFDNEGMDYDYWDMEDARFEKSLPGSILIQLETGTEEASYFFETRLSLPSFDRQND